MNYQTGQLATPSRGNKGAGGHLSPRSIAMLETVHESSSNLLPGHNQLIHQYAAPGTPSSGRFSRTSSSTRTTTNSAAQSGSTQFSQYYPHHPSAMYQPDGSVVPPSVNVKLSSSRNVGGDCALHNETFAPPPYYSEKYLNLVKARIAAENVGRMKSTQPTFQLVKHSGSLLARLSMKSKIIKKWKQCFWIIYGSSQLMVFRNKEDFEEWMFNPFITLEERYALVKHGVDMNINAITTTGRSDSRFFATTIKVKDYYSQGTLHHFKLERWNQHGPTISAAFASKNPNDVFCLRRLICDMIDTQQGGESIRSVHSLSSGLTNPSNISAGVPYQYAEQNGRSSWQSTSRNHSGVRSAEVDYNI